MANQEGIGAQDAYCKVLQMVDEVLIQAESNFRALRNDAKSAMTSSPNCSQPSSAIQSNSDLSQNKDIETKPSLSSENESSLTSSTSASSNNNKSGTSSSSQSSINSTQFPKVMKSFDDVALKARVKTKSYRSLDRKKAVLITSMKSEKPIADGSIEILAKMVHNVLENDRSLLEL